MKTLKEVLTDLGYQIVDICRPDEERTTVYFGPAANALKSKSVYVGLERAVNILGRKVLVKEIYHDDEMVKRGYDGKVVMLTIDI